MKNLVNQFTTTPYVYFEPEPSLVARFFDWCDQQQKYWLMWLAFSLVLHGCVLIPLTFISVLLAGGDMMLFAAALAVVAASVVTNLAGLPTRVTIPVFILTFFTDIIIIIGCAAMGFHTLNIISS